MQRVTRQEAATRLHVSAATIDRMVKRGDLHTEQEPQGSRYRVWVLLDEDTVTTPANNGVHTGDETVNMTADTPADRAETSEETGANGVYTNGDTLAILRNENDRLRELADYRDNLLKDSEWRYHELLQQLTLSQESNLALIRSLPAAITETAPPAPEPPETAPPDTAPGRRRGWWPFRKR